MTGWNVKQGSKIEQRMQMIGSVEELIGSVEELNGSTSWRRALWVALVHRVAETEEGVHSDLASSAENTSIFIL